MALTVHDAHVNYRSIRALQGVSIVLPRGLITAVVGTNGAGKSTLLHAIAGLVRLAAGRIEYPSGTDISHVPIDRRVRDLGILLVPEAHGVFQRMTVDENLLLGTKLGHRRRPGRSVDQRLDEIFELFPDLAGRRNQLAGNLSGGERQMLTIGRAVAAEPDVLLLDEPSTGLAPRIIEALFASLRRYMDQRGVSVLLVEQNTELALEIAEYAYVIERGTVRLEGAAQDLRQDPQLQHTYLGI